MIARLFGVRLLCQFFPEIVGELLLIEQLALLGFWQAGVFELLGSLENPFGEKFGGRLANPLLIADLNIERR